MQTGDQDHNEGALGDDEDDANHHGEGRLGLAHSVRDLVSTTLTLSSRRHHQGKKKQQATVKPIKASDEKVIDSAIAMATALASKSMQDLDKRGHHLGEDIYDGGPPAPSPQTPNSPSKKFTFWFPG